MLWPKRFHLPPAPCGFQWMNLSYDSCLSSHVIASKRVPWQLCLMHTHQSLSTTLSSILFISISPENYIISNLLTICFCFYWVCFLSCYLRQGHGFSPALWYIPPTYIVFVTYQLHDKYLSNEWIHAIDTWVEVSTLLAIPTVGMEFSHELMITIAC